MATLIPTIQSHLALMTSGEKRFAYRLEDKLDSDYLCWHNVPVGADYLFPDFIICHRARGLLVIEVKDWKADTLIKLDSEYATIMVDGKEIRLISPLQQARKYALAIANLLEKEHTLLNKSGAYKGQLLCPYGYGVALSNITRKQFNQANLDQVLPEHLVICKDEMSENVDAESFQEKLWGMYRYTMQKPLSDAQFNAIRGYLFPEIRIKEQKSLFTIDEQEVDTKKEQQAQDIFKIMDIQQEQLARSLGDGHRIIHGVAGSGKTMILNYRAKYLASFMKRPILVLCYNKALSESIASHMDEKGLSEKVHVKTFHSWCISELDTYKIKHPKNFQNDTTKYQECIDILIQSIENKCIPTEQYDAILIDEAHDFEPQWFKPIMQMLNPKSNTLLVLYDDAQSIYSIGRKKLKSFSSVGINARGRTTILKLNYRNTIEILNFAKYIASGLLTKNEADEDFAPVVEPECAGNHGTPPFIIKLPTLTAQIKKITTILQQEHEKGTPWSDMAVIYRYKNIQEAFERYCGEKNISIPMSTELAENKKYNRVNFVTMHSSKGLEFPIIFIPEAGSASLLHENGLEDEARLLYVAITRATHKLFILYKNNSHFAEKFQSYKGLNT